VRPGDRSSEADDIRVVSNGVAGPYLGVLTPVHIDDQTRAQ
jgi:hypothetical protein